MFAGIGDTSPCGASVATEPATRPSGAGGGGEHRGAPPHLRGIIWLIRLPLVYSVSRYEEGDVKFLNFSERASTPATFTYCSYFNWIN